MSVNLDIWCLIRMATICLWLCISICTSDPPGYYSGTIPSRVFPHVMLMVILYPVTELKILLRSSAAVKQFANYSF